MMAQSKKAGVETLTNTMTITMSEAGDGLNRYVTDLRHFSEMMMVLAEMAPDRMTMSQTLFFVMSAAADLAGQQPTYTDIKESIGPALNKSLHTTYRILMEPSPKFPKGLGWLTTETNPADMRVKFLRLTPEGRRVIKTLAHIMETPGSVADPAGRLGG